MAKLVFQNGPYSGKSVSLLEGKSITLGRNRDIELPLPDLKLSRRHCQITLNGNKGVLRDLGSTNGTFLNGTKINSEVELNDFDRIVLGDTEIEYHGEGEAEVLPKNFDSNAQDPFGMNDDDDILPEEAVPAVPSVPKPTARVPQVPPVAVPPSPSAAKAGGLEFDMDLDVGPPPPPSSARPTPAAPRQITPPPPPPTVAAFAPPPVAPVAPVEIELDLDPMDEALADLRRPLPPDPPGSQSTSPAVKVRQQLRFCDVCSGSIPVLDWDLGQAKEVNGHNICKDCLASGAQVPAGTTRNVAAAPTPAPKRSLDDIMAGLEEEAVIVDTTVKRRGTTIDDTETQRKIGQIQKLQEATAVRPNLQRPPVQKPPQKADTIKEGLGDEFEEIG